MGGLGRFATLQGIDDVLRLVASCTVLPHLEIKPLQLHRVLLGVEQGAGYSLLPDLPANLLQAAGGEPTPND